MCEISSMMENGVHKEAVLYKLADVAKAVRKADFHNLRLRQEAGRQGYLERLAQADKLIRDFPGHGDERAWNEWMARRDQYLFAFGEENGR